MRRFSMCVATLGTVDAHGCTYAAHNLFHPMMFLVSCTFRERLRQGRCQAGVASHDDSNQAINNVVPQTLHTNTVAPCWYAIRGKPQNANIDCLTWKYFTPAILITINSQRYRTIYSVGKHTRNSAGQSLTSNVSPKGRISNDSLTLAVKTKGAPTYAIVALKPAALKNRCCPRCRRQTNSSSRLGCIQYKYRIAYAELCWIHA